MSPDKIKTSLIIPNWNGHNYLVECLGSLKGELRPDIEIIIVDNGSTDQSVTLIEKEYPFVRLIKNKNNLGFSKAVNLGIAEAKGDYIILLNNDLIVKHGWLIELEDQLDQYPKVGFCASKMLLYDHRDVLDAAGNGFQYFWTYGIGHFKNDGAIHEQTRRVFGACAGAAIYRKSMFTNVGNFDEDFFIIAEDNDFSFRANLKGYQCQYVASAIVYHHHSASIGSFTFTSIYYFVKNSLHLILKNIPLRFIVLHFPKLVSSIISLFLIYVIAGRTGYCLRGSMAFILECPKTVLKRVSIQRNINISMEEIQNIVLDRYK